VWLSHTAIPDIPPYARLTARSLEDAARRLQTYEGLSAEALMLGEFSRFQASQPTIGERVARKLGGPIDDAARGLGVTLALLVWLAFEDASSAGIKVVEPSDWDHAEQWLQIDEDLRKGDPKAMIESDDIIASQQPEIARCVRERIDATVQAFADEIDLDDVDAVYRMVLVEVLALSYALRPPSELGQASQNLSS
jgi:hypothetical protein